MVSLKSIFKRSGRDRHYFPLKDGPEDPVLEGDALEDHLLEYGSETAQTLPIYLGHDTVNDSLVRSLKPMKERAGKLLMYFEQHAGGGWKQWRHFPGLRSPSPSIYVHPVRTLVRVEMDEKGLTFEDYLQEEVMYTYPYRQIACTGFHPKYPQMIFVVARDKSSRRVFCHALRYEHPEDASRTVNTLGEMFEKIHRAEQARKLCRANTGEAIRKLA